MIIGSNERKSMIPIYQTGIVEGHCSLLPNMKDDSPDTLAAVAINLAARVVFATLCKIEVMDAEIWFADVYGAFFPEMRVSIAQISPTATPEEIEIRRTSECFMLAAGLGAEMGCRRFRNAMEWEQDVKRISQFTPDATLVIAMMTNLFKNYPHFREVCATVAYRLHRTRIIDGDELHRIVAQGIKSEERVKILKSIYDHVVAK